VSVIAIFYSLLNSEGYSLYRSSPFRAKVHCVSHW